MCNFSSRIQSLCANLSPKIPQNATKFWQNNKSSKHINIFVQDWQWNLQLDLTWRFDVVYVSYIADPIQLGWEILSVLLKVDVFKIIHNLLESSSDSRSKLLKIDSLMNLTGSGVRLGTVASHQESPRIESQPGSFCLESVCFVFSPLNFLQSPPYSVKSCMLFKKRPRQKLKPEA